ncbi:MAG TPA: PqqD family protein [Bacteroidales bacterium]|nr:PqqD family protein [Bacteroidales bacterium]
MTDLNIILKHSPSVVTRKTGNEYVLVPIADNIADMDSVFTLNETGAFIWELIDGKKNIGNIVKALTKEYETDEATAEKDILEFIGTMHKYLLIGSRE